MKYLLVELENDNHFSLLCGLIEEINSINQTPLVLVKDSVFEKLLAAQEMFDLAFKRISKLDLFFQCINPRNLINSRSVYFISLGLYDLKNLSYSFFPALIFAKSYLFVHNINSHFKVNNLTVKYFIKSFFRNFVRKQFNGIVVLNSAICKYTIEKYGKNNIYWFPFKTNILVRHITTFPKENIILYPGKIDFNRKKYDLFVQLAAARTELKFVLLGRYNSQEDKAHINRLVEKYYKDRNVNNLEILNGVSEEKDFYTNIIKAKFLFSEIIPFFKVDEYDEIYGITKESGVFWDSIITNTPLILNKEISVPEEISENVLVYKDFDDLLKITSADWISSTTFNKTNFNKSLNRLCLNE